MRRSTLLDDVRVALDAHLDIASGLFLKRVQDLRLASSFWEVLSSGHFRACDCASIGEFGEKLGYSASEARMLALVGQAVGLLPSLRELVLRGHVSLEAASILARVLGDAGVQGPHSLDTWVSWAGTESAVRFRNRVKARLEELRTGRATHEVTIHLTDRGHDDLDRSRVVLGDRARRNVTESEAVATLAGYFLDREDPLRRSPGTRRVGSTLSNRSRHVPAEVRRAVRRRSGGRCEAPFCDITHGLELAHIVPHRDGGGREASDLTESCHGHHVNQDAGWIRVEMVDGRPRYGPGDDGDNNGNGPLKGEASRARWPVPPHLRPNPGGSMVHRWKWTRPPPS